VCKLSFEVKEIKLLLFKPVIVSWSLISLLWDAKKSWLSSLGTTHQQLSEKNKPLREDSELTSKIPCESSIEILKADFFLEKKKKKKKSPPQPLSKTVIPKMTKQLLFWFYFYDQRSFQIHTSFALESGEASPLSQPWLHTTYGPWTQTIHVIG